MVEFGQNWLYLGKSGYIWAKVVIFGQKWLYLDKSGSLYYLGKWLFFSKRVFGKMVRIDKMAVFR